MAEGAAAWARRNAQLDPEVRAPTDKPPIDEPPSQQVKTPGRVRRLLDTVPPQARRILGALIVALVVGGVALMVLPRPTPPPCPAGATRNADGSCPAPVPGPVEAVPVGVRGCTTAGGPGCAEAILSASRTVWPGIPADRCAANESRYGADLYSAECRTDTVSYDVFWRRGSGSVLSTLAGQMITPTLSDFRVPDDPAKLGMQLGGSRRTESGWRFTCVWEYADYPVTLVLDGPNENATVALCGTASFLDSTAVRSALTHR